MKTYDLEESEMNPELYRARKAAERKARLADVACGICILVVMLFAFAMAQIGFGIWK